MPDRRARGGIAGHFAGICAALGLFLLFPCPVKAADSSPPSPKSELDQACRLAEELSGYPVRRDVFRRCGETLVAIRNDLAEAGTADRPLPSKLSARLGADAEELEAHKRKIRDVVNEFGGGLKNSYDGVFADFSVKAEELVEMLSRLAARIVAFTP